MDALMQSLRNVFSDPSSSFTATAIVVAIVVVVVIVLALLLIAAALPGKRRRPLRPKAVQGDAEYPQTRGRVARLGARGCLALAVLVTLGAAVSTSVWYEATSTNGYCTSVCHAMAVPSATWRTSAHRKVSCVRCHEGRHWRSMPGAVAQRSRSLFLEVTGVNGRALHVPSSRCMECHSRVMDRTFTGLNGESFTHREFPATKLCVDCHGAQGHLTTGADEAVPTP